jgi:quinol monooxygenase YgiN
MSITVSVRFHARPGHEAALLAAARPLVIKHTACVVADRDSAWLFQGRDQPSLLVLLADWRNCDAYKARWQEVEPQRQAIAALSAEPPEVVFFRPQARRAWIGRVSGAASCTRLDAAPSMPAPLQTLLSLWRTAPAIVLGQVGRVLYQGEVDPTRFLIVTTWESIAARAAYNLRRRDTFKTQAREHGFSVEHFLGVSRAEDDRIPPRSYGSSMGDHPGRPEFSLEN